MPEIEFSIDTETGECSTEIKGIRGPACEKTARELKNLIGKPARDEKTRDFSAVATKVPTVKGGCR